MFVYALFWDEKTASTAVQNLLDAQFSPEDVSVLLHHEGAVEESGLEFKTKIFEGVLLGPVLGAIGGALLIPGMGWLAAGPLLAALQGATLGGAAGYLAGVLGGLGFWQEEISDAHQEELKKGAVLIGVTTQGRAALAEGALQKAGAETVHRGSKIEAAQDIHLRGKLGEDHQGIREQLTEVAVAADAQDFATVDRRLKVVAVRLRAHLDGEEKYLFTLLDAAHPTEIQALRAEHQKFLNTLEKLNADARAHALSKESVIDFIAALQAYAQREDARLYQWADQLPEHSRRLMSSYLLGLRARLYNSSHITT